MPKDARPLGLSIVACVDIFQLRNYVNKIRLSENLKTRLKLYFKKKSVEHECLTYYLKRNFDS